MQPVYVKDDFFDSLSSGTFGRGGPNGRGRPSERRRVDTEVHEPPLFYLYSRVSVVTALLIVIGVQTFGEFPRHRQPYRGGARGYRGGGRSRGSYYGGRGYGNTGMGGYGNTGTGGYGNTGAGGPGNSYPHRGYGRD